MESVWSVSKLSTESVGSRRELAANCVHTADATKQFGRVGVGGVYSALRSRKLWSRLLWPRRTLCFAADVFIFLFSFYAFVRSFLSLT